MLVLVSSDSIISILKCLLSFSSMSLSKYAKTGVGGKL